LAGERRKEAVLEEQPERDQRDRLDLIAWQANDYAAGDRLLGRYDNAIVAFCSVAVGRHEAKDLRQDIFTIVTKRKKWFNPTIPFRPALYRIARNQCKSWWRRQRPEVSLDTCTGIEAPAVIVNLDLARALPQLTVEQRSMIALMIEGFTNKQIASIMKLPLRTFELRKRQLIDVLRERLRSQPSRRAAPALAIDTRITEKE
jgi:RNA polymerase sigma factor (sigma-70 family)